MGECRLSRFYGIDAFELTPAKKLTLEANMQIIAAEDELKAGVPDDNRLYDLVLAVTGSEEKASSALAARLMQRMVNADKTRG